MNIGDIYKTYAEALIDLYHAPGYKRRVVQFYPHTGGFFTGALCTGGVADLYLDHLPKTGYSHSNIFSEDIESGKVVLIKNEWLSYEEAIFYDGDIIVVDREEKAILPWKGTWVNYGYYCIFKNEDPDGKDYSASEYGEKYIFLKG